MAEYGLATIAYNKRSCAAIRVGDFYWPVRPAAKASLGTELPDSVFDIIADWERMTAQLDRLADGALAGRLDRNLRIAAESAAVEAPIQYPRKVIGVGANYADHVARALPHLEKMGIPLPTGKHNRPVFFFKPASTAVVGPGATVRMPVDCKQFDWEIELSVVIGRRARCISENDALGAVAGYTVGLDMSARDLHFVPNSLFRFDAFAGKGHDTGAPLGPVITPAKYAGDPQAMRLRLWVNDELKQDGSTSGMVYSVKQLVAACSRIVTLEPGDVIMTGTPAGTGFESGNFLKVGDRIRAEIERIGVLEVSVTAS